MNPLKKRNLHILFIEDNIDISNNVSNFFEPLGYILDFAFNGNQGLKLAVKNKYDVIILDLMLPGMDGITLCKKLRTEAKIFTPVLMLTALNTLEDKITGFESGAEDYLVKPFALQELEARINVLGNRAGKTPPPSLKIFDLELDLGTLAVQRAGRIIELTKNCTQILKILMQASPNVVSRNEIEETIWGDNLPNSDTLRSHIYLLR